jgi:hypothetical protein
MVAESVAMNPRRFVIPNTAQEPKLEVAYCMTV